MPRLQLGLALLLLTSTQIGARIPPTVDVGLKLFNGGTDIEALVKLKEISKISNWPYLHRLQVNNALSFRKNPKIVKTSKASEKVIF